MMVLLSQLRLAAQARFTTATRSLQSTPGSLTIQAQVNFSPGRPTTIPT